MTAEQIKEMEAFHAEIQATCNKSMVLGCVAIEMARNLHQAIKQYRESLPKDAAYEAEVDKTFSEDFASWFAEYNKIADLGYAEPLTNTKPSVLQRAFKILDIIPSIVQDKTNEQTGKS